MAFAIDIPSEVLPTPGGPTKHRIDPFGILYQLPNRQEFQDPVFDLFQTIVVFIQDFFRASDVADFLRALFPWNRQQPVQIVARDSRLGGHGRHGFELLKFLDGLVADFLGHAGGFDLFLQLVELALLSAAQLFLDSLDLLVEVVLFLRPLHLPLDSRLDGAVHVQLFDLDVEHVSDPGQTLGGIEDLQQFLLLFDGKLEVGGDGVRQLGGVFHAHSRDHGFVIQRLAQLYILFEQSCNPLHPGLNLRVGLGRIARHAERNLHVAFALADLKNFAALNALDQNLDVAIGQLETLHDVDDSAHLVDLIGLGFVDAGVVLGGQEDLLIGGQRLFQGTNTRFPSHHEWGHHVGEDDHVTNGHHGKLFCLEFFLGCGHYFSQLQLAQCHPGRSGLYRRFSLPRLFHHCECNAAFFDHFPCYFELLHLLLAGQMVHEIEH